jgi:uncharacterized protein YecE (DUF72 family)
MKWHIGCSGFYYRHWKDVYYPEGLPQSKWFSHYCQHFNTLELNGTFYSFPKLKSLQKWYNDSPANFTFAVKAHRVITHYRKFNNTFDKMNELYDVIAAGLQDKLGPVLFQMPPNYVYSEERLNNILRNLDSSFNNVVEMRNKSWWQPQVYEQLAEHNITFCGMSHPTLPEDVVQNTETLYYRLHGNQQLYSSAYSADELRIFTQQVKASNAKQAFIYFNNDIGASAIFNARELIRMVEE